MIEGKNSYDSIEVPDSLDEVFLKACSRGKRTIALRRIKKAAMAGAACVCFVVFTGNETIYAKLSEVPVIGQVVQLIHSGRGGEVTDGIFGSMDDVNGNLQIRFDSEADKAPHYNVQYLHAPERVQVTIDGIRQFDRESIKESAENIKGLKELYFITYLDDSAVKFAIELEEGYDYRVKEFEQPGYLEISFEPSDKAVQTDRPWYIRSTSMDMGEPLALMQEDYHTYQAEIAKTSEGKYAIQIGPFADKKEAENLLQEVNTSSSGDVFYLEECLSGRLK